MSPRFSKMGIPGGAVGDEHASATVFPGFSLRRVIALHFKMPGEFDLMPKAVAAWTSLNPNFKMVRVRALPAKKTSYFSCRLKGSLLPILRVRTMGFGWISYWW